MQKKPMEKAEEPMLYIGQYDKMMKTLEGQIKNPEGKNSSLPKINYQK